MHQKEDKATDIHTNSTSGHGNCAWSYMLQHQTQDSQAVKKQSRRHRQSILSRKPIRTTTLREQLSDDGGLTATRAEWAMIGLNQQIVTQEGQFMRKCYNQRCASKTAKETLMQCDVRCNSIHKNIK